MNPFSTSGIFLMAEAVVVLGSIIVVYLFLAARRRRGERELVRKVVKNFRAQEAARREVLEGVLRDGCGHEDEDIASICEDFSGREKALYNSVMRMYLGRDRKAISGLDDRVQSIVRGYQKLVMHEPTDDSAPERGAGQLPYTQLRKENEALKRELEGLRKELREAKLTAENIMKEYATMYAGGEREGELQVREELKKLRERDWIGEGEGDEENVPTLENGGDAEEFSTDDDENESTAP